MDYIDMREALKQVRESYTQQQIKMAYGILNDPRYKGGNYSGAVAAIEKLAKGLSTHPDVANALRRANESIVESLEANKKSLEEEIKSLEKQLKEIKKND